MKAGFIAFLGFLLLVTSCASPNPDDSSMTERQRRRFIEVAERWQVPQPSDGAALRKVWAYGQEDEPYYLLGFMEPGETNRMLVGMNEMALDEWSQILPVEDAEGLSLSDVTPESPFYPAVPYNVGLATGVQLVRRGNARTGWALIEKGLITEAGHAHSPLFSPAGEKPALMLARSCLAAAVNDILSPRPDFADIRARVEKLVRDQPKLKNEATGYLLAGLEANVRHRPGQPGSMEALIDDYLLAGEHETRDGYPPATRALIQAGLQAVPALIEQRQSVRFSNHLMHGFNNFPSYPMNAGQVINDYLRLLANDELGQDWLSRQKGYSVQEDAVIEWWKAASEMGERSHAQRFTVNARDDGSASLSDVLLEIVKIRYPDLLPELYRSALDHRVWSWPLTMSLMAEDTIGAELKVDLLVAAVATNLEEHRNTALGYLRKYKPDLADRELTRLLRDAPSIPHGDYWSDQDAQLSGYACETANEEVWRAFAELLARADLGMTLELINDLRLPENASLHVVRSIHAIFPRYKDDERVRDESTSEKYRGPGAGFPYDPITVGDFVHLKWARMLQLDYEAPPRDATPADWEKFRESVSPAIERKIADQLANGIR